MKTRIMICAVLAYAIALPAAAQTTSLRTFVSGLGNDTGTCQRATPCRSFAYAIAMTPAGGEIVALDPSGYGQVTITKAISIIGPGTGVASITVPSGGNGIEISAAGAAVSLRGIEIDGGYNGINVDAAGSVDIGAVVINGAANLGVNLNGGKTIIHDSSIVAGGSDAIDVNAGSLVATCVNLANNAGNGFFIQGSSTLTIIDSTVTGSTVGVDTRSGTTFIKGTVISNSSVRGVNNDGGVVYIDTTTVSGSGGTDVNLGTGTAIYSYRNNNFGTTGGTITPISPN